jgi:hypothetical protein
MNVTLEETAEFIASLAFNKLKEKLENIGVEFEEVYPEDRIQWQSLDKCKPSKKIGSKIVYAGFDENRQWGEWLGFSHDDIPTSATHWRYVATPDPDLSKKLLDKYKGMNATEISRYITGCDPYGVKVEDSPLVDSLPFPELLQEWSRHNHDLAVARGLALIGQLASATHWCHTPWPDQVHLHYTSETTIACVPPLKKRKLSQSKLTILSKLFEKRESGEGYYEALQRLRDEGEILEDGYHWLITTLWDNTVSFKKDSTVYVSKGTPMYDFLMCHPMMCKKEAS